MKNENNGKAKLFDKDYFLFDFGKLFAMPSAYAYLKPKWKYENEAAKKRIRGGALFMMNHTGMMDPVLAQIAVWYRRQHFVATTELFDTKFKRRMFNNFHCIEIDRNNLSFAMFRQIDDYLKGGKVVTIYPEGHINFDDDSIKAFKSGVVMMALRSGKPIVPVYARQPKNIFGRAIFVIGEPINLAEKYGKLPSFDIIEQISNDLREKLIELGEIADGGKKNDN